MKSLKNTKTAENLLKSFAGESQARNRYTYFSSIAKDEGYIQISEIFTETADNENEHAKRFFKFLKDDFNGEVIEINGATYPVAFGNTLFNLKQAAIGENEEHSVVYPSFAKIAEEEGFPQIAKAFRDIASVEVRHETRYNKLVQNIEKGEVFKKNNKVYWICKNCGYVHEGTEAPTSCPSCLHPQGYFALFVENY